MKNEKKWEKNEQKITWESLLKTFVQKRNSTEFWTLLGICVKWRYQAHFFEPAFHISINFNYRPPNYTTRTPPGTSNLWLTTNSIALSIQWTVSFLNTILDLFHCLVALQTKYKSPVTQLWLSPYTVYSHSFIFFEVLTVQTQDEQ